MSNPMDYSHRILQDIRFKHIDREQSLTIIRQAEKSQQQRHSNSQFKYTLAEEALRHQRISIIRQIQKKLANKMVIEAQENHDTGNIQIDRRVLRIQRLMQQIRLLKLQNVQPKTVFIKEPVESRGQQRSDKDLVEQPKPKGRLQLLLREIQKARQQVKVMHNWNEEVIKRSNKYYRQPFLNAQFSNNNLFYPNTDKQAIFTSGFRHNNYQNPQKNRIQDTYLTKRESLIHKLSDIPQNLPSSKDSLVVEGQFKSETVVNEMPNSNIYCPSEVILSWKKGQQDQKGAQAKI